MLFIVTPTLPINGVETQCLVEPIWANDLACHTPKKKPVVPPSRHRRLVLERVTRMEWRHQRAGTASKGLERSFNDQIQLVQVQQIVACQATKSKSKTPVKQMPLKRIPLSWWTTFNTGEYFEWSGEREPSALMRGLWPCYGDERQWQCSAAGQRQAPLRGPANKCAHESMWAIPQTDSELDMSESLTSWEAPCLEAGSNASVEPGNMPASELSLEAPSSETKDTQSTHLESTSDPPSSTPQLRCREYTRCPWTLSTQRLAVSRIRLRWILHQPFGKA